MYRILVVEDDCDLMTLFGEAFAGAAWLVLPGRTEENTHARLRDEQPDAVLLDIRLDGPCTGWKLLGRIKADPATQHIPVVICSGSNALAGEQVSWLAAHEIQLISKPFELDELQAVVARSVHHALIPVG